MSTKPSVGGWIFGFIVGTAAIVGVYALNTWTFMLCWNWYVMPVFHMEMLNVPQAFGLSCIVTLLTMDSKYYRDHELHVWPIFVNPLGILVMAWITHFFL